MRGSPGMVQGLRAQSCGQVLGGWAGNFLTVNLAYVAKTFLHSVLVGKLSFKLKHSFCTHANN